MKLSHKKLICSILVLSFLMSIPLSASAIQSTVSDETKDSTSFHDDSSKQNSISLLAEGQCFTTQPIQVIDTHKKADVNYNVLSGFGGILYQKSIIVDGIENPLLCTFEDPEASLKLAKISCNTILSTLSKKYDLDELDNINWRNYRTVINDYDSDPDSNKMHEAHGSLLKQFQSLEAVLEIYEDSSLNNEVLDFVSLANAKLKDHTISKIVLDDMLGHLPNTDSLITKSQKPLNLVSGRIQPNQISGLNELAAANSYALRFAESPCENYRFCSENGDCTNFVSQICYAGGVPQSDQWYYKQPGGLFYSKTWTLASAFANYWKPRWSTVLTTQHFREFSLQLYTNGGSVIGMDTSGNKIYHHLGYVTKRANNLKTRFGRTFYDFFITQHSSNYASWASDYSGRANGWVDQPDGTTYAIFS